MHRTYSISASSSVLKDEAALFFPLHFYHKRWFKKFKLLETYGVAFREDGLEPDKLRSLNK